MRTTRWFVAMVCGVALATCGLATRASADQTSVAYLDPQANLLWAQPADFSNVSWNTLRSKCNPGCDTGESLNGHDLTGWRVAAPAELQLMLEHFAATHGGLPFAWNVGWSGNAWFGPFGASFTPTASDASLSRWSGWTTSPVDQGGFYTVDIGQDSYAGLAHVAASSDGNDAAPSIGAWLVKPALFPNPSYTAVRPTPATPAIAKYGDYDGDGKADVAVYRPSTGVWYLRLSAGGTRAYGWGLAGDQPVPGDYDGDGKFDLAVYRPSTGEWIICWSASGFATFTSYAWGLPGDVPVPFDYNTDGKTDPAVYRPSTGAYLVLGFASRRSVRTGSIPVPGIYVSVATNWASYTPATGEWYVLPNASLTSIIMDIFWGLPGDVPVLADYDGDSHADVGVYRPSTGAWWIMKSSAGFTGSASTPTFAWGLAEDVPVPADFDGDGKTDPAVYRPSTGTWYVLLSGAGYTTSATYAWGLEGDRPLLGR